MYRTMEQQSCKEPNFTELDDVMDVDASFEQRDNLRDHEERPPVCNEAKKVQIRNLATCSKVPVLHRRYSLLSCRSILTASLVGIALLAFAVNDELRVKLTQRARYEYSLLFYGGEDSCNHQLDYRHLYRQLWQHVTGQEEALRHIERLLEDNRKNNYTPMAFVGDIGVGKSLTANVIMDNYPWKSHIYRFQKDPMAQSSRQFTLFKQLLHKIQMRRIFETDCVTILVVVDNLKQDESSLVSRMNAHLKTVANTRHLRIIALFVFRRTECSALSHQQLGNISIISFRKLNELDVIRCVRIQLEELQIVLDEEIIKQVIASVNVQRHGCKSVRAKLDLYS